MRQKQAGPSLVLVFLVLSTVFPEATSSAATRRVDVPSSGVELGLGWLTERGQVVASRCIEFAPVKETGQVATVTMREVSDQSEIMKSLGVSAAISVKTMAASGSARASFARDSKVKTNSTNLVLEATVENGVMFTGPARPPSPVRRAFPLTDEPTPEAPVTAPEDKVGDEVRLRPWALEYLDSDGIDKFRKRCGDGFVSAIYSGAQVLASIQFREEDSVKRQQIKAVLKAKYGPGQVAASVKALGEAAKGETDLTITYLQVGGGKGALPITRDGLAEKLETLPEEAFENPKFLSMEVTPYEQLADWPKTDPQVLAADPERRNTIVADYYWFLTTFEEDIEEILSNPTVYDFRSGYGLAKLRVMQDRLIGLRRKLLATTTAGTGGRSSDEEQQGGGDNSDEEQQGGGDSSDEEQQGGGEGRQEGADGGEARPELSELIDFKAIDAAVLEQRPEELAEDLAGAVLFENPNVLRVLLPLPAHQSKDETELTPRKVIDWYVRPQAIRMCALDPLDARCLTNAELEELEAHVPMLEIEGKYRILDCRAAAHQSPPELTPCERSDDELQSGGAWTAADDLHPPEGPKVRIESKSKASWLVTPTGLWGKDQLYSIQSDEPVLSPTGVPLDYVDAHTDDAPTKDYWWRLVLRPSQTNDSQRWILKRPEPNLPYYKIEWAYKGASDQKGRRRFVGLGKKENGTYELMTYEADEPETSPPRWCICPLQ